MSKFSFETVFKLLISRTVFNLLLLQMMVLYKHRYYLLLDGPDIEIAANIISYIFFLCTYCQISKINHNQCLQVVNKVVGESAGNSFLGSEEEMKLNYEQYKIWKLLVGRH